MKLALILLTTIALTSCDEKPTVEGKAQSFTLPDGTPVERHKVTSPALGTHFIYVVRGADSVTNNYRSGKARRTEATIERP